MTSYFAATGGVAYSLSGTQQSILGKKRPLSRSRPSPHLKQLQFVHSSELYWEIFLKINISYFSATVRTQSPQSLSNSAAVSQLGDASGPESRRGEDCQLSSLTWLTFSFQLGVDATSAMANDTIYQIQQQLNVLKKSTQECGIEIEKTRQMQEHHSINFYKHHQISGERGSGKFLCNLILFPPTHKTYWHASWGYKDPAAEFQSFFVLRVAISQNLWCPITVNFAFSWNQLTLFI